MTTFSYQKSARVSAAEIKAGVKLCASYTAPFSVPPVDGVAAVQAMAKRYANRDLKYVVVCGIGGSNLGTQAVYEALGSAKNGATLLFLDTVSPDTLQTIRVLFDCDVNSKKEFLLNIITKSGTTTETIANAEALYAYCTKRFGDCGDRVVVTTDEGSPLWREAQSKHIATLAIPKNIGGRYSVFTAVGLFPLALAGLNIKAFSTKANIQKAALESAAVSCVYHKQGVHLHNHFFFNPCLETLGKWSRQLIGESLGKSGKGIVPLVSVGSTDLHSMAQLYFDLPATSFVTRFIYAPTGESAAPVVPKQLAFGNLVKGIAGKPVRHIMSAIFKGVTTAYKNQNMPFTHVTFSALDEKNLGAYMQFSMLETMYLAHMLKVNAFDQPAVEVYKEETRKILR